MKPKLLLLFLLSSLFTQAQQITLDTSETLGNPGEITEYWYWAWGVKVTGTGFASSSIITITATAPDSSNRIFTVNSDSSGNIDTRINAMRIRSVIGTYTITAADQAGGNASSLLSVIVNPLEVLDATITPATITSTNLSTEGATVSIIGFAPNAELDVTLFDPSENGYEVNRTEAKFADENGVYTFIMNGETQISDAFTTFPLETFPGVWRLSFSDFSGNGFIGEKEFRILPNSSDAEYCQVLIRQTVEPITTVEFAGITNNPEPNSSQGYENFSEISGNVHIGNSYTVKLKGRASNPTDTNTFTVFIDWNQNGVLDDAGEIYTAGSTYGSTEMEGEVLYNITVPESAVIGSTTMRILKALSYSSTAVFWPSGSCGYYNNGQVEDYTLNVEEALNTEEVTTNNFKIYPNPTKDILNISGKTPISSVKAYDFLGKLVIEKSMFAPNESLSLSGLSAGIYLIRIDSQNTSETFKVIKN